MNEELQSTNEELETSKEELQSLNEELATVNNELREKLEELEAINNDLANLLSSTDTATIFLDGDLRLKRFTPSTKDLFNLIPTDVGRPIKDISNRFAGEDMVESIGAVMDKLHPAEAEVTTRDGAWYIRRILPYRTEDKPADGAVVTFTDVSTLKRAKDELALLAEQVRTGLGSELPAASSETATCVGFWLEAGGWTLEARSECGSATGSTGCWGRKVQAFAIARASRSHQLSAISRQLGSPSWDPRPRVPVPVPGFGSREDAGTRTRQSRAGKDSRGHVKWRGGIA